MGMGSAPLMVLVLAAALAVLAVSGAPQSHLVEELPGQEGSVDFRQYAGYITVDSSAGRALFYYFVTTPDDAHNNDKITDTANHHHHHHYHHHHQSAGAANPGTTNTPPTTITMTPHYSLDLNA